jgi:hypothetical protein
MRSALVVGFYHCSHINAAAYTMSEHEMTLLDFAKIVRALRISQQLYFHTRSRGTLADCKEQEREVDAICRRLLSDQPELL